MSSPITFSGFNNIDFNTVLNALMQQASEPLTNLQSRQSDLKTQVTTFDTLNTRVSSLRSAADALGSLSSVSTMAGTSTDSGVAVTAGSGAVAGHYDVVVNELARAQVTASSSTVPDATSTIVASGGTLTIGGVDVAISGDATLQDLATAINNTDGIGVTAAAVRVGPSSYRLALTSLQTGTANAFTVTNNLTGGTGVTFDGTNAVEATDASILVNNLAVTNSSNTFDNIVPGVTFTVSKKDPSLTVGVDLAPDSTALSAKVSSFISAYNDLVSFIDTQRTAAGNGDTSSIGRDPLLRQLRNGLRTQLLDAHGSGTLTRLSEAGIEFTTDGTLQLNQTLFDEAVATNGDQVRQLFADTSGAFPAVGSLLDEYSSTGGLISSLQDRLNTRISSMDGQISDMQARLAQQRASLQQEFIQADLAMSQLKNQSGSLANFGTSLGGGSSSSSSSSF